MIPQLIGAGVGLIGGIGKMFSRGAANRRMAQLMKENPQYQINPEAQARLGLAKNLFNARMPGASYAEANIASNQANTMGNAARNAASGSQLLALGSAAQGQADQSYNQLAVQEQQDQQRRLGNLEGAQQGMIQEGDKVFNDRVRNYENKVQMEGAMAENRASNWGDISKLGFGFSDFAGAGGVQGLFGNRGGGGNSLRRMNFDMPQTMSSQDYMQPSATIDPSKIRRF